VGSTAATARVVICFCLLLLLSGANGYAQTNEPVGRTPVNVNRAEQLDPPAVAISSLWADTALIFWIGADERGVHQDARRWQGGVLSAVVTLPLPPVAPYAQTAVPMANGGALLLWLDRTPEAETGLFAALITDALTVERGPILISTEPVYDYAALPQSDGEVMVVYSGGVASEPTLVARRVDGAGRAYAPTPLGVVGTSPALSIDQGGAIWLFWMAEAQVWAAQVGEQGLMTTPNSLTSAPYLQRGDRLLDLRVGSDGTTAYLFWNIARATGTAEAWMATGQLVADFWTPPASMGVSYAAPLAQAATPLPVAVTLGEQVSLRYWRAGQQVAEATNVSSAAMLRPPSLSAARSGDLWLAWAQPALEGAALMVLRLAAANAN